eukprot:TRINITY_DN33319_c0_g1_i1.p1 TRINITY_DN33319_c0_g1~~TRINITY_DN33319_c0_g1_i1.p1  ORF type:complete len:470 (-),score=101.89 TRINITY_DN33319_c0_g1_i1:106-1464(-)
MAPPQAVFQSMARFLNRPLLVTDARSKEIGRSLLFALGLGISTLLAMPLLQRLLRRRRTSAFEFGPLELSQMTVKAAKELHQASKEDRTSLIPDALEDLEEQGQQFEVTAASVEVDQRAQALTAVGAPPFRRFLRDKGVEEPKRSSCRTLQLNIGLYCNQACSHCHVESSPLRSEMMSDAVVEQCLLLIRNTHSVDCLDITGGAPELNSGFQRLVLGAAQLRDSGLRPGLRIIDRCNLTVLLEPGQEGLANFLAEHRVDVVASLPSYDATQTDKQRGRKVFERSIQGLRILNELGYGTGDERGLRLDLVFNPPGPFLPPKQDLLEAKYKQELATQHGVKFDRLITIANMPIKRYFDFLRKKGMLEGYMDLLVRNFNKETVPELMCTNTVSVDWRGDVFDCDFNQQLELHLNKKGSRGLNIFDLQSLQDNALQQAKIITAAHCFGCTAAQGSG